MKVTRQEISPDGTRRYQNISIDKSGDLVWSCQDLGPGPGVLMAGSTEYEFWRTIRAEHVPALALALGVPVEDLPATLDRDFKSDVDLKAFAEEHEIPTEFSSWLSSS